MGSAQSRRRLAQALLQDRRVVGVVDAHAGDPHLVQRLEGDAGDGAVLYLDQRRAVRADVGQRARLRRAGRHQPGIVRMLNRELRRAAERPVVDAGVAQHVHRDAAAADRGRQQGDVRPGRVAAMEPARRRLGALLGVDAGTVDDRQLLAVAAQRHAGAATGREDDDALGPVADRREAVARIAAADGDEDGDAVFDQTRHPALQAHLGARAALEPVGEPAAQHHRGDPAGDGGLHQRIPRLQRCVAQRRRHQRWCASDSAEGRVEAQLSGV